jgi:cation:H+ antiporter
LIVGLTVVAFGTSAPELGVSLVSALDGRSGIALGNVIGSNLCNVFLILGVSALFSPLPVSRRLVTFDVPFVAAVSLLLWVLAFDGVVGRLDGALLFAILLVYIGRDVYRVRKNRIQDPIESPAGFVGPTVSKKKRMGGDFALILAGLLVLGLGSHFLVLGAVGIAQAIGLSELVIGLTVVALGTSLPEIATSVIAGVRGKSDIAVGNIVGSNLFNILAVIGLTSMAAPSGIPVAREALFFDLPLMAAAMLVCLPVFYTGMKISRLEGAFFLGAYVLYAGYLLLLKGAGPIALM